MTRRIADAGAAAALCVAPAVAAQSGQSPLEPHSVQSAQIETLAWVLFGGGALVFLVVLVTAVAALRNRGRPSRWAHERALVVGGGIAFPALVLFALLVFTLVVGNRVTTAGAGVPLRIAVSGEMWWWRVEYAEPGRSGVIATANELHVPAGVPVEIVLTSADVIHSLWMPGLAGMLDAIPGRANTLRFTADTPGRLRGQCTEYCGIQHANMTLAVVVHEPAAFAEWLAAQARPASAPATPALAQGRDLFVLHCGGCHAVRGTAAAGRSGPDLTHAGGRVALAGTALPVNAGTLAGWIAASQQLKPGNHMPSFTALRSYELLALAAYVESLR